MDLPSITHPTFRPLSSAGSPDPDSDAEDEEVDQLVSDSEEDVQPSAVAPATSPHKTRHRTPVERVPGKGIIPLSRMETLLEADGEESFMSKEALFLLAAATEEFIKRLLEAGHRSAHVSKRSMVNYRDVASAAQHHQEFTFLQDTIPQPISLAEALQRRAAKEREILEEPPISNVPVHTPSAPPSVAPSETPSATPDIVLRPTSRSRGKGRQAQLVLVNGDLNGEHHEMLAAEPKRTRERRRKKQADEDIVISTSVKEATPTHSHRTRRRSSRTSQRSLDIAELVEVPSHSNGHSTSTNGRSASHRSRPSAEWGTMGPPSSHSIDTDVDLEPGDGPYPTVFPPESRWPPAGHFTGPASGYLEDHRMLFSGRNGMAANPGRTIYNPHRQPNR